MTFRLKKVDFMPSTFDEGVLYLSEEFGIAIHLCACGCGEKVKTPIGPTEWKVAQTKDGPTVYPSIGNWQQACRSHYFIRNGRVVWMPEWTESAVELGRKAEMIRREAYYEALQPRQGWFKRFWRWLLRIGH